MSVVLPMSYYQLCVGCFANIIITYVVDYHGTMEDIASDVDRPVNHTIYCVSVRLTTILTIIWNTCIVIVCCCFIYPSTFAVLDVGYIVLSQCRISFVFSFVITTCCLYCIRR